VRTPICLLALVLMAAAGLGMNWVQGGSNLAMLRPGELTEAGRVSEPLAIWAAEARARGERPVWNAHNGLGEPVLQRGVFWWPLAAWPSTVTAFDIIYALRLLVAACGAWFVARRLRMSALAALTAAASFGMVGAFARDPALPSLDVAVWLPWLWLSADAVARGRGAATLFGHAVVVYAVLAAGASRPGELGVMAAALLTFAAWRVSAWRVTGVVRAGLASIPPILLASDGWLSAVEFWRETSVGTLELGPDGWPAVGWVVYGLVLLGLWQGLKGSLFLWSWFLVGSLVALTGWAPTYAPAALAAALLAGSSADEVVSRSARPALVVVGIFLVIGLEVLWSPPAAGVHRVQPAPAPNFMEAFGREVPGGFRVMDEGGVLSPNRNAALGLNHVGDAGRRVPNRYRAWWDAVMPGAGTAALDAAGVRYLLRPAGDDPGGDRLTQVWADEEVAIWRREDALPIAFFPRRFQAVPDAATAFSQMTSGSWDPREVAYLETATHAEMVAPRSGSARVVRQSADGLLELRVQASEPGTLVVSVLPYPGLQAEIVLGEQVSPVDITPCNGAMCAVDVPRGRFEVRLRYEPTWGWLALVLRVIGAGLLLALAVIVWKPRVAD